MASQEEFLSAVTGSDPARVRALVEENPTLASARNESGVAAPLLALYHRKRELAEELLALKESLEPLDVFEAAAFGRTSRLEALLEREPHLVDAHARDGFFPLGLAAFFGQEKAVELLLSRGANVNLASTNAMKVAAIHAASAEGGFRIARLLIEAGADVNAVQQGGFTPLHAAAMTGQLELARLLLARGADTAKKTDDGRDALAIARDAKQQALVDLLS